MAQIKIFGLRSALKPIQGAFSDVLHACAVEALQLPQDKRFHRFFFMDQEDFIYPGDRTDKYTIIEISMFEGRSAAAKKQLIQLLFEKIPALGIGVSDLEITIFETPKANWGIRGLPGDELHLNYRVDV
ncbi:4-oxalocrotonate tautomerase [Paenibacillus sp. SSG-1]|uniref:tautomerase family protein n=1 Tax=Paenibacillus sp. SSG-1 TaxID=1443669 RepID=UPI000B7E01C3|nr:tautomerase family protein [Paenibacillus sp. SSG-1]OXL81778.1 4-oxalocrotonate tautomerase [Paenibacillus sp. SSG-1]